MMIPGQIALAWLGRHGPIVIAVGVFAGLLLPPLASLFKPLLVPAIVLPFIIALLRVDWSIVIRQLRQPTRLTVALTWLLLASPVIVFALAALLPLPEPIVIGLVLTAGCPPLMASPAFALMLGLDAATALTLTITATILVPFSLPVLALGLLGIELDIDAGNLMLRLALVVGGSIVAAWLLRRLLPSVALDRRSELDGLAVIGLLVFAIGVMDGVTALAFDTPSFVLSCLVAVFALNIGLQALGSLVYITLGRSGALSMGLLSGNNNMGLVIAALAERAPFELVVFVAMAQFPIYLLPALQRPFYRRWLQLRS